MNFTCSFTHVDDTVTVTPYGDIDLSATANLRETLQLAAKTDAVAHVVVDLTSVTFIDSTALGVLIAAHTTTRRRGATFAVINPGPMVTMVLTVTGLFDVLVGPGDPGSGDTPATATATVSGSYVTE